MGGIKITTKLCDRNWWDILSDRYPWNRNWNHISCVPVALVPKQQRTVSSHVSPLPCQMSTFVWKNLLLRPKKKKKGKRQHPSDSQWNSAVKMGVVIYYDSGTQKKLQTNGRYFSNSPTHQPQQFQTGLTEHGQCDGVNKWRGRGGIGGRTLVHCTIVIRPSHDADLRLGDVAYHLVDCV